MAAKAITKKPTASKSFIDLKSVIFWVLAVVFICYANSLTNGYNMDDEIVTINHPLTSKGLSAIPEILKSPYFQSDIYSYEYRPVVHISFAIEHQFLGQSPFVSHLINLLLYLVLVYVAFDLLKRLFPTVNHTIIAAIVLVFALHPTHTEVVASIKNRDEILALLFSFLAWREAIKFATTSQWWRIILVLLLFNLAMGSKVTVVPMVLLIPLSIWLVYGTINLRVVLLSFVLSANGMLWFQQFFLPMQIKFVGANGALFAIAYLIHKRKYIASLFTIKGVDRLEDSDEITIDHHALWNLFKNNLFVIGTLILINVIVVAYYNSQSLLFVLILIPIIISLFASKNSKGFWFLVSLVFSLEFVLIYLDSSLFSLILLYITLLISVFIGRSYFTTPILISLVAALIIACFFSSNFIPLILVVTFLSFKKIQLRYVALAATVLITVNAFYEFASNNEPILYLVDPLFTAAFIFSVNFAFISTTFRNKYLAYASLIFLSVSYFLSPPSNTTKKATTTEVSQETQVNIIPTQSYRPVLFAEFPVNVYKDPLDIKMGTSATVLLKYLKLVAIPYPLSFYYGYSEIKPTSISNTAAIVSIILHLLLLIAAALSFKRNMIIAFGIVLYLISIAPFSAFVAPIPGVMADRYLFTPSLGFAMVLIGILIWFAKIDWSSKLSGLSALPKNARYVIAGLLVIYASLTIARNNDWKDRLTLFRNDIVHVPNSAQAHNLLAFHLNRTSQEATDPLEQKKLMEEAVFHFQRATEIWPEFMNATYDLGRTHEQLGNWDKAIAAYKRTFEIDTSFSDAIFRMGIVYEAENKLDSAVIAYKFVTVDNPLNITAFNNLSYCYFKKQEYRNAIETGRQTAFYHPTSTDPIINIGKTFLHIKETDSALYYFEKVYPNRAEDKGLTEVLYKLWNEKGNTERAAFYYRRMQIMGMVR
jgi:tetratricopeptide (TPR) repeat protein